MTLAHYQTQFDQMLDQDHFSDAIQPIRLDAFSKFLETGFPTQKWEDWRFTNLSHMKKQPYRIPQYLDKPIAIPDRSNYTMDGVETIVIYNGIYQKELSSNPDGIRVLTGLEYFHEKSGRIETASDNPFDLLNTAFMDSGLSLVIDQNTNVTTPIRILFISSGVDPIIVSPRVYVDINESSSATFIEHHVGDAAAIFQNSSIFISVTENALLNHIRIQSNSESAQHVANLSVNLLRNSQYNFFQFAQGIGLDRSNIRVKLKDEGAQCTLNGLSLSAGNQHLDSQILMDHLAPNCTSFQNFKSILQQNSSGVFNGRVIVRENAQKTNAEQSNKNLILSKQAGMNSNPQMEIYADDVRCAHGSSTGELNKEVLFYLRSRGLDTITARSIMIRGFAAELLDSLKDEGVKHYLTTAFDTWIREKNKK